MELFFAMAAVMLIGTAIALAANALSARHDRRPRRRQRRATGEFPLLDLTEEGFVLQTTDGRIEWVNRAFEQLSGWTRKEIVGRQLAEVLDPPDLPSPDDGLNRPGRAPQTRVSLRKDGTRFWNQIRSAELPGGGPMPDRSVTICKDVTERVKWVEAFSESKALDQQLWETDALTGLYSRLGIDQAMISELHRAQECDGSIALFQLDLRQFQKINARFGLEAGDAVLQHVARVLVRFAGEEGKAARTGADRFTLLLPGAGQAQLRELGDQLARAIARPVAFGDAAIEAQVSIGAVAVHPDGTPPAAWMRQAHFALEQARRKPTGGVIVFDNTLRLRWSDDRNLSADLSTAFERNEICVFFQPIADLAEGRVYGFECLVRWHHPGRGWLGPATFLPKLQDLGLSEQLDRLVIEEGLSARRIFESQLGESCRIALNVFPSALQTGAYRNFLQWVADRHDTPPALVELEIQPPDLSDGHQTVLREPIDRLLASGFRVTLDHFSRGHAGFDILSRQGAKGIKLDGQHDDAATGNADIQTVLRSLIGLARELQVAAIATGIETPAQSARMLALGCPLQQGFWIARPMPLSHAVDWIASDPLPALRERLESLPAPVRGRI